MKNLLPQLIKSGDELLSECEKQNKLFIFYPEVPPILLKDTDYNEDELMSVCE
jgi:hypothetical protein